MHPPDDRRAAPPSSVLLFRTPDRRAAPRPLGSLSPGEQRFQRTGVENVRSRRAAAPGGVDGVVIFASPATECASVEQTIGTPARSASRTCSPLRSRRGVRPLTSSATPWRSATSNTCSRSSAFSGRRPMIRPFGWLRQRTAGCCERLDHAPGHLLARHPLPAVHAGLDPVELGEHVVGEVEPAVGQDVALDPAQDAERREALVGGGDLLALAADVVGGQATHRADGRRVVADGDVVVATLEGGAAHLLDAEAAVGPGRMAVQVAADVALREQLRRLAARTPPRAAPAAPRGDRAPRRRPPRSMRRAMARAPRRTQASLWRAAVRCRSARARRPPARPARPRSSTPARAARRAR